MTTALNNTFDQDFEEFLGNCETLMEIATSKDFDKQESFVILLGARHLEMIADNAVSMFEMDIAIDSGDRVAHKRLNDVRDCIKSIARIIARMEANMLVCGVNLN